MYSTEKIKWKTLYDDDPNIKKLIQIGIMVTFVLIFPIIIFIMRRELIRIFETIMCFLLMLWFTAYIWDVSKRTYYKDVKIEFKKAKKTYEKIKKEYLKTNKDTSQLKIDLQISYDDYMIKKAEYKKAKLSKKELV